MRRGEIPPGGVAVGKIPSERRKRTIASFASPVPRMRRCVVRTAYLEDEERYEAMAVRQTIGIQPIVRMVLL